MEENKRKIDGAVRINKYLSQAGICSRRQADTYVEQGKVLIDGEVAVSGDKVMPGQEVTFCGKPVKIQENLIFLAFHKPRGIVCTSSKKEKDNIIDYLNYPQRIYPVGRLDKDSQGLILLTNDGEAANQIMKARNYHEKEYEVTVNKRITKEFLDGMRKPVPLDEIGAVTRKCKVTKEGPYQFRIILTQGLNRQIRRMCEYFGYRVTKLKRVRVMNIKLGDLKEGSYRELKGRELHQLREELDRESIR
ncbi:pseudouridine synthase [Anaerostipes sp. MSJ-23]|uniref:pseudouridine synthase n=1 Tax=Anaerostipes sp. MSJ-23 TaxID=2841520 RepID=UPI001C10595E|nr:pseudouridine synthase [Anaerostipes sp. MSJ-23]MBU5459076.1 pseudouridine synthase [Anaerostipes sp. MSJ-23]